MLCAIGVNEVASPALLVMVNGRDYASHCCDMLQWTQFTHVNRLRTLCVLYMQLQAPDSGQLSYVLVHPCTQSACHVHVHAHVVRALRRTVLAAATGAATVLEDG